MSTKQKKNSLLVYWESLSGNFRTRSREMSKICAEAEISYSHVKSVMNGRRSLGIDSATRLISAIKKRGGNIELTDLLLPTATRK